MKKEEIFENDGLSPVDKIQMNWVDVPQKKEQISISKHWFRNKGTTCPKQNE